MKTGLIEQPHPGLPSDGPGSAGHDPSHIARKRVSMRQASFADYVQITELHRRNGLASRKSLEDWTALWRGNPAYQPREGAWPVGWVLETADGEIVGSIGNVPLEYSFRGKHLLAATGVAWAVDPPYRGCSILLLSQQMNQPIDLLIATTVSQNSELPIRALNWERIPSGQWSECGFWITNRQGFAAVCAANYARMPLLRRCFSAAVLCRDAVARRNLSVNHEFTIKFHTAFDSRFDEFWEESKRQNHERLLAVRTRETLAWHYSFAASEKRLWILCAFKGTKLAAYAVFERRDRREVGLKRIRLVDCQVLAGFEAAVPSLLSRALEKSREHGIHVVENHGCWLKRLWPQAAFPYRRKFRSWSQYYKAKNSALTSELKRPDVWAPSSFDGDASL